MATSDITLYNKYGLAADMRQTETERSEISNLKDLISGNLLNPRSHLSYLSRNPAVLGFFYFKLSPNGRIDEERARPKQSLLHRP